MRVLLVGDLHGNTAWLERYSRNVDAPWGPLHVVGLDCDATPGNLALLECTDREWTVSLARRLVTTPPEVKPRLATPRSAATTDKSNANGASTLT